ncbi:MAG: GNAT family N-acetyltransferase [Ramlibacter sp.]
MIANITIRSVERFEEPVFTELVNALLHDPDRRPVGERLFGAGGPAPAKSGAHQVRVGAFDGEALVGWSHAWLLPGGQLYVGNSAVRPEYRRQGVYNGLMACVEAEARALGCVRVESHHRAENNAVIIAKLKAGYTIVGTEFVAEMGLLLKMCKHLDPRRDAVFRARVGTLEGTVRGFGPGRFD